MKFWLCLHDFDIQSELCPANTSRSSRHHGANLASQLQTAIFYFYWCGAPLHKRKNSGLACDTTAGPDLFIVWSETIASWSASHLTVKTSRAVRLKVCISRVWGFLRMRTRVWFNTLICTSVLKNGFLLLEEEKPQKIVRRL